jgi:ribulose-phosphate 3-epimerase
MPPLVAPSILAADFGAMARDIAAVEAAGADWIHLDVMDGHFVPNLSFGPMMVKAVRGASKLPYDTHLMISHPTRYAPHFAQAGADLISFHVECDEKPAEVVACIRALGKKVGAALKPKTPLAAVRGLLKDLDFALVMSVEPGFGGQSFMADMLPKVAELKRLRAELGLNYLIEIDGGIDEKTAPEALAAGVDVLVAGTAVFGRPNWSAAVKALRGAA